METTIQVDGLKTCYLEEGAGPPVVFLHGASLGSSARAFERNLLAFAAAGFRAIAYDQPGFGLTDNPTDYTASYRTQFIVKFLDAIDASLAALVGHSQAAGMAARVALQHPAAYQHWRIRASRARCDILDGPVIANDQGDVANPGEATYRPIGTGSI